MVSVLWKSAKPFLKTTLQNRSFFFSANPFFKTALLHFSAILQKEIEADHSS